MTLFAAQRQVMLHPDLVMAFARYTGDHSSLHTDPDFGRRSMFGSTVVHGLLPVALLPLLLPHRSAHSDLRITRIRGRFLSPLVPGDHILLRVEEEATTGPGLRLAFEVRKGEHGPAVTRGVIELAPGERSSILSSTSAGSLVPDLQEAEEHFDQLRTGTTRTLPFHWDPSTHAAYRDLLQAAAGTEPAEHHWAEMAQLAGLSTLVGMVMPGRTATFQEFELQWEPGVSGAADALHSTLTHLSSATRTLAQEVTYTANGRTLAQGKVHATVARPPFSPPTMEEITRQSLRPLLQGQVALITGAARGLGATTAQLFAAHGARVVVNYRASKEQAEAVVAAIRDAGGEAMAVQADVTDHDAVQRLVAEVIEAWGTVHVLVNNAVANYRPVAFQELTWAQVQDDIDVIVKGAFHTSQAVLPAFLAQGGGRIVNISSVAAETPPMHQAKYVLAKSALNGLTRALAVEFADRQVAVNLVVPSFAETDLTRGFNAVALGKLKAGSPLKRLATPLEIAEAVLFLASSRSGFTTGQKLMVTGGLPPFL